MTLQEIHGELKKHFRQIAADLGTGEEIIIHERHHRILTGIKYAIDATQRDANHINTLTRAIVNKFVADSESH